MYPLIKFNNIAISSYAYFNALAYGAALFLFFYEARRKKFPQEAILCIILAALIGTLAGSRLGSVLFVYWNYYSRNLSNIFFLQLGGKTLVGGLIGGYLGVVIMKRILKFSRSTGDLFAPSVALGISIGRIGCFLNGCCFGVPANFWWGVNFKGTIRHPTQIYESIFCLLLFIALWGIRKKIKREGDLFKIFVFAYSFFRFWIEFLRDDKVLLAFKLSTAQLISLVILILLVMHFSGRKRLA